MTWVRLVLAAMLGAAIASPQSATVLLQRAKYLEDTAGDVDGAIQVYRQLLASPDTRTYEAVAQYHLGACLMKKGLKDQAARVFAELMKMHPEQTNLVAGASIHYVDSVVGYSLTVPKGWTITPRAPSQGPGSCAQIEDPENKARIDICAKPETQPSGEIDSRLAQGAREVIRDRRARWQDFAVRPGFPQTGLASGQHVLTIVADYTRLPGGDGARWTEWTTWVQTERTRSSVVMHMKASDFEDIHTRFMPILSTFRLP